MKYNISATVDSIQDTLFGISEDLWNNPEVAYQEKYACLRLTKTLEDFGFEVDKNIKDLPTAFVAKYGSGSPKIGLLAEFDALPAFSQKTCTHEEPVVANAPGHACGHNLMAGAHIGAAIAIKKIMEENKLGGTIILFGCPAEEVLTGKVFMLRNNLFNDIDCALNFHPGAVNGVNMQSLAAIDNVKFNFHGKISHAAARPYDGRSASDAAELMNVGANYLREHIPDDCRIHYVTPHSGEAPNIVPKYAQTWYHIRAKQRKTVDEVYARLCDIARGAALMTGTEVEIDFQGGCSNSLQNEVLAKIIAESMQEIGGPEFTSEDQSYAKELNATCPQNPKRPYAYDNNVALFDSVLGLFNKNGFAYNASDIGDISQIKPTVMFNAACFNLLADLHSWQVAACTNHHIGKMGMVFACKVLAMTSLRIFTEPNILAEAKKEFEIKQKDFNYECPIPSDVKPPQ